MVTTPRCHPNCIGDPCGIWWHQMGDRTQRDGDNPKMSPKLHWGPLWDLVAPDGDETQRDADKTPRCHPSLHWGPLWDLVAPDGDATQRDGDKPKVSPIIALGTPMGSGGTKWGQDSKGW